jgi:predicted kinase
MTNAPAVRPEKSRLLVLAGTAAVGKTTTLRELERKVNPDQVALVFRDDYARAAMERPEWKEAVADFDGLRMVQKVALNDAVQAAHRLLESGQAVILEGGTMSRREIATLREVSAAYSPIVVALRADAETLVRRRHERIETSGDTRELELFSDDDLRRMQSGVEGIIRDGVFDRVIDTDLYSPGRTAIELRGMLDLPEIERPHGAQPE